MLAYILYMDVAKDGWSKEQLFDFCGLLRPISGQQVFRDQGRQ